MRDETKVRPKAEVAAYHKSAKGRFPHAVLHTFRTEGMQRAIAYAQLFSDMNNIEARNYVSDCVKTDGQPHLIDLYEAQE